MKTINMNQYKFKTNIKCGGCIAAVKPHLDSNVKIKEWKVDTENPEKILTVTGELSEEEVRSLVEKAGYKAEVAP